MAPAARALTALTLVLWCHSTPVPTSEVDQVALQYEWGLLTLASSIDAIGAVATNVNVPTVLLQLTKLSALPLVADSYARPDLVSFDSLDRVVKAGLSSGLSRDLVQFKARWERLGSRHGLSRLAAARRSFIGRLLLYGQSAAEHLEQGQRDGAWHEESGGNASNTATISAGGMRVAVRDAGVARNQRSTAALAASAVRYLAEVGHARAAANETTWAASVIHRRLNLALGIHLHELEDGSVEGQAPAAVPATVIRVPDLSSPQPMTARQAHAASLLEMHVEGDGSGGQEVRGETSDLYGAVQAADTLLESVRDLSGRLLPDDHVVAACAITGALSGWAPLEAKDELQVARRTCGCGDPYGACETVRKAVLSWVSSRDGFRWDCCAPHGAGPFTWPTPACPPTEAGPGACEAAALRADDCAVDGSGCKTDALGNPVANAKRRPAGLTGLLSGPLGRLRAYYQREDQRAMATDRVLA